jgi:ParB/Sulfiredoxin domain
VEVLGAADESDFLTVFKTDPRWRGRGWPDQYIFRGFPHENVAWQWVLMTDADVLNLFHIRGGPGGGWNEIAAPDYRVSSAVPWFTKNPAEDPAVKVANLVTHLRAGGEVQPIIVVGTSLNGELVLMDGNHRVASAVQAGVTDRLRFLVGTSPLMSAWAFYL